MGHDYSKKVEDALAGLDLENKTYRVELKTNLGTIRLDLYPHLAPKHCRNILGLTQAGFYDGLTFHRIVEDFVIQGGCPEGTGTGGPGYQVAQEFNKEPHKLGTLSMARAGHPDSAGSQFFICLGEVPYLDGQYTVFGQADAESLEVVQKIGALETNSNQMPLTRVTIEKATVLEG
jgi:peptidyl-prolyl cis-trans isomerase B (cyclophilin B)